MARLMRSLRRTWTAAVAAALFLQPLSVSPVLGATVARPPAHPKAAPAAPAACGASTLSFTQSSPLALPTGPVVLSSSLVVSGAGPYLFDLDLTANLTHTFSANLDITLTSPAGTVVTLTTDNGGGNDNVFNGTLWDDDADPGGALPYTTNAGLTTDRAYVNLTTATPMVPEEAMGAFIGENPNGTWTLTLSEDLAGDSGVLGSWTLDVTTFPVAPATSRLPTLTQSTMTALPTGPVTVITTLLVPGVTDPILDVDITTSIRHTSPADLDITLTSPAGTVVTLTTDNGGGNDDVFNGTRWDDDANPGGQVPYSTNDGLVTDHAYANLTLASPLVPEEALAAFMGENPNGSWTLTISDDLAGEGGFLGGWSLDIETFSCTAADLAITKSDGATTATPGATTTYTIVASNAGPSPASPARVTDSFPAACTGVTWTSVASGGAGGNTPAGSGDIDDAALSLPAGGSVTYTATCTISSSATGFLTNFAAVSSAVLDLAPENNHATDSDELRATTNLALTKALASPGAVQVGDDVTFTLTVHNEGPSDSTGAIVTDILPPGLGYVSNDCGAGFAAPALTWNVGPLAANASATCNLAVTISQAGTITNLARVAPADNDPIQEDDTGVAVVTSPVSVIEVPTLDTLGLAALLSLLVACATGLLRRRRRP